MKSTVQLFDVTQSGFRKHEKYGDQENQLVMMGLHNRVGLRSCTARRLPIRPTMSAQPRSRRSFQRTGRCRRRKSRDAQEARPCGDAANDPLGMRLFVLTIERKSELQDAVWDEVDFENVVWTRPTVDTFGTRCSTCHIRPADAATAPPVRAIQIMPSK